MKEQVLRPSVGSPGGLEASELRYGLKSSASQEDPQLPVRTPVWIQARGYKAAFEPIACTVDVSLQAVAVSGAAFANVSALK